MNNRAKGFTLLEVLLSIAIIASLSALSVPVYQSVQVRNDVDVAATTIAQGLRRAQTLSQASQDDTTWGLYVQSGAITLFSGASYAARDTDYDEDFDMPTSITPSGVGEVIFSKFSGKPNVTGDIILTTTVDKTRTVTINSVGAVIY